MEIIVKYSHFSLDFIHPSNNLSILSIFSFITEYADRYLVIITQLNKIGTLVEVRMESAEGTTTTAEVVTLLGKRDDALIDIYARQILDALVKTIGNKPLLLGIAIVNDDHTPEVFKAVLQGLGRLIDSTRED